MHNITDTAKYQEKRTRITLLVESLQRLGEKDRAIRVEQCGTFLGFVVLSETERALREANFCRERLCPMCGWRRSLKIFQATSSILDYIDAEKPGSVKYLFLTLTVKNCPRSELTDTLDAMAEAWKRVVNNRAWQRRVIGSMRTLEITYNAETDTYHPHYHMILAVPKDYGKKGDKLYWSHEEWVAVWRKAARLNYDPMVSIERVKGGRHKGISEVSKYAVKDTDLLHSEDPALTDKLVSDMLTHLKGRRLVAYTGVLREAQKALKLAEPEECDLTDAIRGDVSAAIVRYRWSAGLGIYQPAGMGSTADMD